MTGTPLSVALRTDLLAPAGLDRVAVQTGDTPASPHAYPATTGDKALIDTASGYLPSAAAASLGQGGAGIAADAPSLARWGFLLYGGRVIDSALVKVMETPDPLKGDWNYGFGTMIATDEKGNPFYGHAGNFVGYTSLMLVWADPPAACVVLTPENGGPQGEVRSELDVALHSAVEALSG